MSNKAAAAKHFLNVCYSDFEHAVDNIKVEGYSNISPYDEAHT